MADFVPQVNYYPTTADNIQTKPIVGLQPGDNPAYNLPNSIPTDINIVDAPNGSIMKNGQLQSPNYAVGVSGWIIRSDGSVEFDSGYFRGDITGASGTFSGSLQATSINIPDTTTANSFHVDSSGNTWWGANVANGYANANAYVLATGYANFKNIAIGGGTLQYQVVNAGIFSFGDGSDGAATFDGSATPSGSTKSGSDYTLTRDVYYTTITMSTGTTLNPAGYRIFATTSTTLNGTAVIKRNGNNGGNASGAPAIGTGGAALADGYLKGSAAGGNGGRGGNVLGNPGADGEVGADGANTSNSIGSSGSAGGMGSDGTSPGANGGAAGTATQSNVKLIANWHLATLLDIGSSGSTVKFNNSAGSSGGGGGGANGGQPGGSGGGGGSAGGIVAIYSKDITIGASASITGNGGNGGDGFGESTTIPAGGGGAGANGGQIILVYNTLTNSGSLSASGGTGGARGGGSAGSNDATAGANGNAGNIRQFQISM